MIAILNETRAYEKGNNDITIKQYSTMLISMFIRLYRPIRNINADPQMTNLKRVYVVPRFCAIHTYIDSVPPESPRLIAGYCSM